MIRTLYAFVRRASNVSVLIDTPLEPRLLLLLLLFLNLASHLRHLPDLAE